LWIHRNSELVSESPKKYLRKNFPPYPEPSPLPGESSTTRGDIGYFVSKAFGIKNTGFPDEVGE